MSLYFYNCIAFLRVERLYFTLTFHSKRVLVKRFLALHGFVICLVLKINVLHVLYTRLMICYVINNMTSMVHSHWRKHLK